MKITRIRLQGIRAFDEPFELDLAGGKNLLLHGANGSGKSSIYARVPGDVDYQAPIEGRLIFGGRCSVSAIGYSRRRRSAALRTRSLNLSAWYNFALHLEI
jgi:Fe-S cluster assembly ATPase SufC